MLPKSVLENRTNEPENECFCVDEEDEGKCPNTGAMFLGACYDGERPYCSLIRSSCLKCFFLNLCLLLCVY